MAKASTRRLKLDSVYTEEGQFQNVIDYDTMVSHGNVSGHIAGECIGISGQGTISTTSYVLLSNATVTQPSANTAMKIVSTSANDSSTGTGANQVTVEYLPFAWATEKKSEVISMNGLTAVALRNTDVFRIEAMYINKIGGSGSGADGTITLVDNATGLIKYAQIDSGSAIFERCIHYVPTGKRSTIKGFLLSTSTIGGGDFQDVYN